MFCASKVRIEGQLTEKHASPPLIDATPPSIGYSLQHLQCYWKILVYAA